MLYLSRLVLDPTCPRALTDLSSPYEMHRTLSRAFPARSAAGRVLFRVEHDLRTARPVVLLQSSLTPDWGFVDDLPGYLEATVAEANPVTRVLAPSFTLGQPLAFRLRAAPTFKRGRRRLAWLHRAEQLAWLQRQGLRHGFQVVTASLTPESPVWCYKSDRGQRRVITLRPVLYAGLLQVTRPEGLTVAVAAGLGSGKAFGCGLLSVVPPR